MFPSVNSSAFAKKGGALANTVHAGGDEESGPGPELPASLLPFAHTSRLHSPSSSRLKRDPPALATSCLHPLFTGSTYAWLSLETISARTWAIIPFSKLQILKPTRGDGEEGGAWIWTQAGMPTILMAGQGCGIPHQELTFPSSRWPVNKTNPRQQPLWVEFGLYSWKTKLAGLERRKRKDRAMKAKFCVQRHRL